MQKRAVVTLALVLACAAPAARSHAKASASTSSAVESKARRIEKLLTAPCCYKGTLADHASGVAQRMRTEIRAMLTEGKTQEQILAHYKKKYGQAILMEPPKGALSGFLLYGVPFGLAFLGLLIMTVLLIRRRAASEGTDDLLPESFQIPPELEQRIDQMVRADQGSENNPGAEPA